MTYEELNKNSNSIASELLRIIKENKLSENRDKDWIISLCMKPSINLVTTLLAIWKAGAAYLPIDVSFLENRVTLILEEARPTMIIYDSDFENVGFFKGTRSINFEELLVTSQVMSSENIPDKFTLTGGVMNMALMLYTSGSTGVAKGVRLMHKTAQARLEWQWRDYPFMDDETHCVFKSSVTFIDHFGEIWNPLLAGRTLVIIPKNTTRNPEKMVPILEKYNIQRMVAVPTLLRGILLYLGMSKDSEEKQRLAKLRLWINSGEVLTIPLARSFFEYFSDGNHTLATFYGTTELMGDVVSFAIHSQQELDGLESIPIGDPSTNTMVYILDEKKKPLKECEVGEIYVAGDFLASGYINEREPEMFLRNHLNLNPIYSILYRTGDFGHVKDGLIYFEGRRDTQIKVHGHRVEFLEIENVMNALSFPEKSSIQVYNRGEPDQALLVFITVKRAFAYMTAIDIEAELNKKLPNYMVPQVILLYQFPYLPNGKVDVQALMKSFKEQSQKEKKAVMVEMDLEDVPQDKLDTTREVFQIIGDSIGHSLHDKISLSSSFFHIGGNSLNTIICVGSLRRKNYDITITDFMKAETIGDILDKIEKRQPGRRSKISFEIDTELELRAEPLTDEQKDEYINLIGTSFLEKGDLDRFLDGLQIKHYVEFIGLNWNLFMESGLSFVVLNLKDQILGVSLNFEVGDEPRQMPLGSPLETIMEYLGYVEADVM